VRDLTSLKKPPAAAAHFYLSFPVLVSRYQPHNTTAPQPQDGRHTSLSAFPTSHWFMSVSPTTMRLPREGSTIRLVGLRNPSLNGAKGKIAGYTRDNERVMVALLDKEGGIVKVKPKQMELVDDRRRRSSNGNSRHHSRRNSMMKSRSNSGRSSVSGNAIEQELLDTLKSADAMFDLADTDGNGYLTFEEFEYYMKRHTSHSTEMIQDVFAMIDKDGDGEVTKEEVRANFFRRRREMVEKNGGSVEGMVADDVLLHAAQDADKMFDKADTSGDGELSLREFQLYMKRHTKHSDLAISELFSMMDADNDGYVTREEVRRVFLKQKQQLKLGGLGGGPQISMRDLLGVEDDDDMAELSDDVYSMFFLADMFSQSFWYAWFIFVLKQTLIMMIAVDVYANRTFPDNSEVPKTVRFSQLLLMPVNFALQEELVMTFFIYGNLKWHQAILQLNPNAYKWKYHLGNLFRFMDGLSFLFINTSVMLQATDILGMFLNFAALQFLQSIDNVALSLAKRGYLTEPLEDVAKRVEEMKLPRNNNESLQLLDSVMMATTFIILLICWLVMILVS
jgi:Ca2+-binding EF-hand superfamily protein